jgi:hypothetical protein
VEGGLRVYVEAYEQLPPEATEEPDFIRIDVTGLSEREVQEVISIVRELMEDTSYILQLHYCYHDEEPVKPCNIVVLETV